jgi:hypothetical protein
MGNRSNVFIFKSMRFIALLAISNEKEKALLPLKTHRLSK